MRTRQATFTRTTVWMRLAAMVYVCMNAHLLPKRPAFRVFDPAETAPRLQGPDAVRMLKPEATS